MFVCNLLGLTNYSAKELKNVNISSLLCLGEIQCEQPNNSLYTFTGNLLLDKQTLPLSPNQLLLRVNLSFWLVNINRSYVGFQI